MKLSVLFLWGNLCYDNDMNKKKRKKKNLISLFIKVFAGVIMLGGIVLFALYTNKAQSKSNIPLEQEREEIESVFLEGLSNAESKAEEVSYEGKYGALLADAEQMKADNIYAKDGGTPGKVTLAFAGDVMFDDSYSIMNYYRSQGADIANCIGEDLLQEMKAADIFMLNNECTFTTRGVPTENKAYTFRAKPEHAAILTEMGADIVSIANNHTYDYGEVSLLDTLDTIDSAGIRRVGAGRNLEEARKPVYYIVNDIKIAIVAATQIERTNNPDTKGATNESPGVFRCMEPEALAETIAEAKANSDFVIAYIHWGSENTTEIDWAQRDHSKLYVEAGADLIIGDHPHCLQGITYIEDTPVVYSLGNFWFNSRTIDTGIVKFTLNENGIERFQFIPALQSACRTTMLQGAEKERVLQTMRNLSPGVSIDSEGDVSVMVTAQPTQ